ncbi:hypothetical protein Tco_0039492 [Tanacetum coccineum]
MTKGFIAKESVKGHVVNVVKGLKLYEDVLNITKLSEESTATSSGRICISTRSHKFVLEKVHVEVHGEIFEVYVHELGTWSINITDDSIDTSSHIDMNEIEKVADSVEENSVDDLNDLNDNFNEMAHGINEDEVQMDNLNATTMEQP